MAFQLTINGVDYTDYFIAKSVVIQEGLRFGGFTMSLEIMIENQAIPPPQTGNFIVLTKSGTREFSGRIGTLVELQTGNPNVITYSCECVDQSHDLDFHLINKEFSSQLAGDMIKLIATSGPLGFSTNNVVNGITVQKVRSDRDAASSLMARIAEAIEHQIYVDYDRDINFFFVLDRDAPILEIDVDTQTHSYSNLEREEIWEQVKNRIHITGVKVKSGNQDGMLVQGDGATKFFALGYEPWDLSSITVRLDGVAQTLLLDGVDGQAGDGLGSAGQVYVCVDNWGCRFPDGFPPGVGVAVDIDYNYAYEPVITVEDPDSIIEMRSREDAATAPSDGVHELRFEVPDLRVDSEDAIWEYGQLLLLRYSSIIHNFSFESHLQGWKVGQNLRIFSTRRGFDMRAYVISVEKRIEDVVEEEFDYAIVASSNMFPG